MSLTTKKLHEHEHRQSKQHTTSPRDRRWSSPDQHSLLSPAARSLSASNFSPGHRDLDAKHSDTGSLDDGRSPSVASRRTHNSAGGGATENVKVICRVRPFAKREYEIQEDLNASIKDEWEKRPLRSVIGMQNNSTIFLDHEKDFAERQRFDFDVSLWSIPPSQQDGPNFATQDDVMNHVGRPALEHVWNGYNTCIFAYGQTGSGKTYTMMGTEEEKGLIPHMCQELFKSLEKRREEERGVVVENTVKEYSLEARFLEIYNEKVKDLLWSLRDSKDSTENIDKDNLKVRNFGKEGPVVVGLTTVKVESWEDCLALIEEGTRHRSVAATKMNETSSRSHSIFRLNFIQTTKILPTKQFEKPKTYDRISNVSLVDLAGSERNKKTGAEGARLKEAVAINLSLTTLKNVIDALVEGRAVVPYRDSQLTWLLSENLGGNSKTFMISCVSPHWDNAEETLNTLRYAMRAQSIVNHASVNESDEMKRMNRMRQQLEEMQKKMQDNPDEDILRKEYQETVTQLASLKSNMSAKAAETKQLEDHMARTKKMQYNAAFSHAFKITFLRRVANYYNDTNITKEQQSMIQKKENKIQQDAVTQKEQDVDAVRIEEELACKRRLREEEKLDDLKTKCQGLEERKRKLLINEDDNRSTIEAKQLLKLNAKDVVKVLLARNAHLSNQDFDKTLFRDRQRLGDASENEEVRAQTEKTNHDQRMDGLRTDIASLRAKIEEAREKQQTLQEQRSKKIANLHAEAIFYENENKNCFQELESGLSKANHDGSATYYKDKEALTLKQMKLEKDRKLQDTDRHTESRVRDTETRADVKHEMREVENDGEKTFKEVTAMYVAQEKNIEDDYHDRNERLDDLNNESVQFLRNVAREDYHVTMWKNMLGFMKRKPSFHDSTKLVEAFNNATSHFTSNLPSKFVVPEESPSPTPRLTPRDRHRHSDPRGLNGAGSSYESPTPVRKTSPLPKREVHVASLAPPKKYVPQPTKASLLRLQAQNYLKKQDAASPPAGGLRSSTSARRASASPAPTAAGGVVPSLNLGRLSSSSPNPSRASTPRRAATPTRVASTSVTTPRRADDLVPKRVSVGNTYIISRSKSPRVAPRNAPTTSASGSSHLMDDNAPVTPRTLSTISPRRHGR